MNKGKKSYITVVSCTSLVDRPKFCEYNNENNTPNTLGNKNDQVSFLNIYIFSLRKKNKDRLIHDYKFISVPYFQFLVWTKKHEEKKINTGLLQTQWIVN